MQYLRKSEGSIPATTQTCVDETDIGVWSVFVVPSLFLDSIEQGIFLVRNQYSVCGCNVTANFFQSLHHATNKVCYSTYIPYVSRYKSK